MTATYRCSLCGNRTRFDVYEQIRRKRFAHVTLGGDVEYEDEAILDRRVEKVVCRWCDRSDGIEVLSIQDD